MGTFAVISVERTAACPEASQRLLPYAHTVAFSGLARTTLSGELDLVNADGSKLRVLDRQGESLAALPQWNSRSGVIGYTRGTLAGGMRQRPDAWVDYLSIPSPYPSSSGRDELTDGVT